MNKTGLILAAVLAAVCLAANGAPDTVLDGIIPKTPEGKIVKDLFGRKIADAKATPGEEDDLDVARQLMTAQADSSTSAKLRTALSLTALRLTMTIGTERSDELARQALEAFQKTNPLEPLEKNRYLKEIASHRLAKARSEHKGADDMAKIASEAVEAAIAFVREAVNDEGSSTEAAAILPAAKGWIIAYGLKNYSDSLGEVEKAYKSGVAARAKLKDALDKLGALRRAREFEDAKAASRTVAEIYLEGWGNLKAAAKYYEDIEGPQALTVRRAAAMLEDPGKMDMSAAMDTLEGLTKLGDSLKDSARANVNLSALRLAKAYLSNDPPESSIGKVKLMIVQLEAATGQSPNDKLRKDLIAAYGPFQGKLEILGPDRVRLTYDFSNHNQIKDWTVGNGQWDVGRGVLACRTDYSSSMGLITCKFPFRQDKPFKVSYTGGGRYEVSCTVNVRSWTSQYERSEAVFSISEYGLYYGEDTNDHQIRIQPDKAYKVEGASQGDGKITWTLGGQNYQYKPRYVVKGSFQLQLRTRDSDRALTAFRNVVIEGTILPKADWTPEESKKTPPDRHPPGR